MYDILQDYTIILTKMILFPAYFFDVSAIIYTRPAYFFMLFAPAGADMPPFF